jgi:hypothetical protein
MKTKSIIKNYPDNDFIKLFNRSNSINEIIRFFNLNACGSQYLAANEKIRKLNLDTSKFDKSKYKRGRKTKQIEQILTTDSNFLNTHFLKKRLVREGKLQYKCSICSIEKWLDKKLSLQLDHINGIRTDNRIENLRLLCPNCHSQCDTYAGKNKRK